MVATNFADISKRNYKTIGEIRRALIDLGNEGKISGNLRNILVDISQRTGNADLVSWINDDKIENLLGALSEYDENLKIENIQASETKAEGNLDEAKIEALVAEYEEYLAKHGGNRDEAFRELEKNRGKDLVRQFRTNLEEHYQRNLKKLVELKVKDPEKVAEIIAEKEMVGKVKDLEAFEKTVSEAITNNRPDLDEVARLTNEKSATDGIIAARLVAEIKVDRVVMDLAESMVSQMQGNNRVDNSAVVKVPIATFVDRETRQKLVEIVEEVLRETLVDGEIDKTRIAKLVEDRARIKLDGFGEEVTRAETALKNLKEENPISVTIYTDEELTNEVFKQTLELNPDKPEEALEFAKIVARANSPSESPFNRLDSGAVTKEVKERLAKETQISQFQATNSGHVVTVMSNMANKNPEQWLEFRETYAKFDNLKKPIGTSYQVRALDGLMKLSKDNPNLTAIMQRTQAFWGGAKKIEGVLTKVVPGKWAGFKQIFRLDSNLVAVKGVGTVGKIFGQIQGSVAGKALFQLATEGLTLNSATSFFLGTAWGASFKLGLQTLGKKAAGTAIGKALIGLGAKLGIKAAGAAATGPVGWVIGALLMIPDLINLAKIPLNKVRGFLGKLGLDFIGDAKKILQDLGIGGLPGTLLGGVLTMGAAIVLLPTLLLGIGLPWMLMGGVLGGINVYSILQHGMYATFAPPILVQPGSHGLAGEDLGPYPTLDPNITITPGCPSKTEWPLRIGIVVTQGPGGKYSHYYPGHTQAVDFSAPAFTPIYATHNGIVEAGNSSAYGYFVDIVGECNGIRYRTRYAHMPAGGRLVSTGETVTQGQQIGVVDNTGRSSGNHLHYELMGTGIMERINNWLPRPVQEGV